MRILKHGAQFKGYEEQAICPDCQCEFMIDNGDIYWFKAEGGRLVVETLCPECDHRVAAPGNPDWTKVRIRTALSYYNSRGYMDIFPLVRAEMGSVNQVREEMR